MSQLVSVLLVEDNPRDACLLQEVFHHLSPQTQLRVAPTGIAALDLLHYPGSSGSWRLQLIVLDLLLPDASGWDILVLIKVNPRLRTIPLVMFTGGPPFIMQPRN